MDERKEQLRARLAPFGQEHVLAFWDQLDEPAQSELAAQLEALDLRLIADLHGAGHAAEDWAELARRAVAPPAVRLADRQRKASAQDRGWQALAAGQVGVVLVAGGQGTRLGFDHPKGMFSIGPVSGLAVSDPAGKNRRPVAHRGDADSAVPDDQPGHAPGNGRVPASQRKLRIAVRRRHDLHVREQCRQSTPPRAACCWPTKGNLALSPDGHGGTLFALAPALAGRHSSPRPPAVVLLPGRQSAG